MIVLIYDDGCAAVGHGDGKDAEESPPPPPPHVPPPSSFLLLLSPAGSR